MYTAGPRGTQMCGIGTLFFNVVLSETSSIGNEIRKKKRINWKSKTKKMKRKEEYIVSALWEMRSGAIRRRNCNWKDIIYVNCFHFAMVQCPRFLPLLGKSKEKSSRLRSKRKGIFCVSNKLYTNDLRREKKNARHSNRRKKILFYFMCCLFLS